MSVLTLDIGNSAVKCMALKDGEMLGSIALTDRDPELIEPFIRQFEVQVGIFCNVAGDASAFVKGIEDISGIKIVEFNHSTPVPIRIEYSTPGTLGLDRIAAAVGALATTESALVVDAGTAITLDVVAERSFKGGNISPGVDLRFRSLHEFTSRLPLEHCDGRDLLRFGDSTSMAIRSGVLHGVVAEIISTYNDMRTLYPEARVILTGGNAPMLARLINEKGISADLLPSLVGRGLEEILKYNINKRK